jgi:hypothetical protein
MSLKSLIIFALLATPISSLADPGAAYDNMYDSTMHEKYHEPLHVGDKVAHKKGSVGFIKADKNKDGKLSEKEAQKLPEVSKNFAEIDTDKDGTVDRDEIHIFMSNKK